MLGMAWMPSVDEHVAGGLCERYAHYDATPSLPGGSYSLNTLVVTQRLRGARLPDAVTSLTVTHELGHSFGADHDDAFTEDRPDCLPGARSEHGNYIMAATAPLRVNHAHNWMFSRSETVSTSSSSSSAF